MIDQVISQASQFHPVEWIATVTAILYLVYAVREKPVCWIWGMISCSFWAYASFAYYNLYLDAILQLFYVAMAVVGLYQWRRDRGNEARAVRPTTSMSWSEHGLALAIGLPLTIVFGYFFDEYTPAAATYADALTTVFSVLATVMLVRKQLENWIYWVITDAIYIYLYAWRGAWLFTLLMVVYTVLAAVGYFSWRKQMKSESI